MKKIYYVTSNVYKYKLAVNILKNIGLDKKIKLQHLNLACPEIQDQDVENIALYSARWAAKEIGQPVITSDTGFCIEALNNFPGPFVKYVNNWLTARDILLLLGNNKNRKAYFIDAMAYVDQNGLEKVFFSKTIGKIIQKESEIDLLAKKNGWTMDTIFIPQGFTKVLSKINEKDKLKAWNTDRWVKLKYFLNKLKK